LATPRAFQRNPKLVWEWYQWRRSLISRGEPNPGHKALVQISGNIPNLTIITQNVDGLHQQSGSSNVIELHGNIMRSKCYDENHQVDDWQNKGHIPPRCPLCGSLLRPDVVWFGENLPPQAIETALHAAQNAEVFFSIGTSSVVEPAASLPHYAIQAGAVLIEINPNSTPLTEYADYTFKKPSGTALPEIVRQTWP
jgi:NAD-dependent deacetylase